MNTDKHSKLSFDLPTYLKYDQIQFQLGIDSLTNVSGAMGGDLDPTKGMYWTWQRVDENWNSAYPYAVGPTFYGNKVASKVASISESTTIYTSTVSIDENIEENLDIIVFPNPANDFIAIQFNGLVQSDIHMPLYDMNGRIVYNAEIKQGSTISYIDARTLYTGEYFLYIPNGGGTTIKKIVIKRN
jgi:hypothetical protein